MRTLLLTCVVAMAGCNTSQETLGFKGSAKQAEATSVIRFFAGGQKMEYVYYEDFNQWMATHERRVHLDALAPVDRGGHGYTTAYLVVYTEQKP